MEAISRRLHEQGEDLDHPRRREQALIDLLHALIRAHLAILRGDEAPIAPRQMTRPREMALLEEDFSPGTEQQPAPGADRQAWSYLYYVYVSPWKMKVGDLCQRANVPRSTLLRRRKRGIRLLGDALRRHEQAARNLAQPHPDVRPDRDRDEIAVPAALATLISAVRDDGRVIHLSERQFEDTAGDEVLFRHQLLQEYFAARRMAVEPALELVQAPWRADAVEPTLDTVMESLAPADPLPPLPSIGWEEMTVLAAAMADDPDRFIREVQAANLVLAGRCAASPEVVGRVADDLKDDLRGSLVRRSRDPSADLRARIAAGLALGEVGDPRFERRSGPYGDYLMPPMVEVPGCDYVIGDDEPLIWGSEQWDDHTPRHTVVLAPFAIGKFPVTNAEWACFIAAAGYEDERWWDTENARAWR